MARTVNQEDFALKRREILDATQRLVFTRGYAQISIRDILDEIHISSGAFHHYFASRAALLEALIERMQMDAERPLKPIVQDPKLSAVEKLQRFFALLDSARSTQKAFIADLARVWFADDNAIVREKVAAAIIERRGPLLTAIIRQGVEEGSFHTPYPEQAGGVILYLAQGLGSTLVKLMLAVEQQRNVGAIVATYAAYSDAVERVLGAEQPFIIRPDAEVIRAWLD